MGKKKKTQQNNTKGIVLVVVLSVFLAALLMMFVLPQFLYSLSSEAEEDAPQASIETEASVPEETEAAALPAETETVPAAAIEFPLRLENGALEIESLFQFDGINPDCENQEGNNIATITVTNTSGSYLESAALCFLTDSGEPLNFKVTDLPAGKTALVFSTENAALSKDVTCADVSCEAVFNEEAAMNADKISVSVESTQITLQNNTDTEIENIVVYCHASLGDQYFGGITYPYSVNNLPANGTAEVDAAECFLGLAEVVRIAINES